MDQSSADPEIKQLKPLAIFGFNGNSSLQYLPILLPTPFFNISGKVKCGIKVHPAHNHILFPLGNKISIVAIRGHTQEFLVGHDDVVTALDVSSS